MSLLRKIWKSLDIADNLSFLWTIIYTAKAKVASMIGGGVLGGFLGGLLLAVFAGLLVFFILSLPDIIKKVKQRGKPKPIQDAITTNYWLENLEYFLRIEINLMSFRHLWNDKGTEENTEPYLLFNLHIRNDTQILLNIMNCTGQADVNGDACHEPIVFQGRTPIKLGIGGITPTLKQNISAARGRELMVKIKEGKLIEFALGSVDLKIEDDNGANPKNRVAIPGAFGVDPKGIDSEHHQVTKRQLMFGL